MLDNFSTPLDALFNITGLIGMALILLAYFMQQLGRWQHNKLPYLLSNITGAACLMVSLLWSWNLASFLLECAWLSISIYGLLKYKRSKVRGLPE